MLPTVVTPARRRVLEAVASCVPVSAGDCVRVGVDGVDGAGKTVFADHLAEVLRATGRPVVRVCADDFLHPRSVRHRRGRDSPEGFWLDSYDYPALRQRVLDPLGPGGSRRYQPASHDPRTDRAVDPAVVRAGPGSVLLLDGLFLHRDELADVWDLSVLLEVPVAASVARLAARDGSHPDPAHPSLARYVGGQRLYRAAARPLLRADLVVDATDLDAPTLRPSRKVRLRPLHPDDAPVMAAWARDAGFRRQAGWSSELGEAEYLDFWRRTIEGPPAGLVRLGVLSGEDLLGYVDLQGEEPGRRELGFVIGARDRWGQGLGFEAARAALDHAFRVLRVHEVWAEALDANARSVRILQRLGMHETGPGEAGRFLSRPTVHRRFTTGPRPAGAPHAGDG